MRFQARVPPRHSLNQAPRSSSLNHFKWRVMEIHTKYRITVVIIHSKVDHSFVAEMPIVVISRLYLYDWIISRPHHVVKV